MTNEANQLITLLITAAWDLPRLQHLDPLDRLLLLVERAIGHLRRQGIIINP